MRQRTYKNYPYEVFQATDLLEGQGDNQAPQSEMPPRRRPRAVDLPGEMKGKDESLWYWRAAVLPDASHTQGFATIADAEADAERALKAYHDQQQGLVPPDVPAAPVLPVPSEELIPHETPQTGTTGA